MTPLKFSHLWLVFIFGGIIADRTIPFPENLTNFTSLDGESLQLDFDENGNYYGGTIPSTWSQYTNLTSIDIAACETRGSLAPLANLSRLTSLLILTNYSDVSPISRLSLLNLEITTSNSVGLQNLARLQNLTHLKYSSYDGNNTFIQDLTSLTSLDLAPNYNELSITRLTNLQSLSIRLTWDNLNSTHWARQVNGMTTIKSLHLEEGKESTFLTWVFFEMLNIQSHSNLGYLVIDAITTENMHPIDVAHIHTLEYLAATCYNPCIEGYGGLSSLRTLELFFSLGQVEYLTAQQNLEYLSISCEVTDAQFDQIHLWTNLTSLEVISNPNSSYEVDVSYLSHLTALTYLNLITHIDSGNLSFVSPMRNLEFLSLRKYQMVGNLKHLSGLKQLTHINLQENRISGDLSLISHLLKLTELSLSTNRISGSVHSLSNLTNLLRLDLGGNRIFGSLDPLTSLELLQDLNMNSNRLTGTMDVLSNLKGLTSLNMGDNSFSGTIDFISELTDMSIIFAHENLLEGTLEPLTKLTDLELLSLDNNYFTGTLDPIWDKKLIALLLDNNKLSGTVPPMNPAIESCLIYSIFRNELTGTIDHLVASKSWTMMLIFENNFVGTLPTLHSPDDTILFAHANRLSGDIKASKGVKEVRIDRRMIFFRNYFNFYDGSSKTISKVELVKTMMVPTFHQWIISLIFYAIGSFSMVVLVVIGTCFLNFEVKHFHSHKIFLIDRSSWVLLIFSMFTLVGYGSFDDWYEFGYVLDNLSLSDFFTEQPAVILMAMMLQWSFQAVSLSNVESLLEKFRSEFISAKEREAIINEPFYMRKIESHSPRPMSRANTPPKYLILKRCLCVLGLLLMLLFEFLYVLDHMIPDDNTLNITATSREILGLAVPIMLSVFSSLGVPFIVDNIHLRINSFLMTLSLRWFILLLAPFIFAFLCNAGCMNYWTVFWNPCNEGVFDVEIGVRPYAYNFEIMVEVLNNDDICATNLHNIRSQECFRNILRFMGSLSFKKMCFSAVCMPILGVLITFFKIQRLGITRIRTWSTLFVYIMYIYMYGASWPLITPLAFLSIFTHSIALSFIHHIYPEVILVEPTFKNVRAFLIFTIILTYIIMAPFFFINFELVFGIVFVTGSLLICLVFLWLRQKKNASLMRGHFQVPMVDR